MPSWYAGGALFATVLFEEGTDAQKDLARLWLEKQWSGSMILTEPDAGSDVGAASTKAIDMGENVALIGSLIVRVAFAVHQQIEGVTLLPDLAQCAVDLRRLRNRVGKGAAQLAQHLVKLVVQLETLLDASC